MSTRSFSPARVPAIGLVLCLALAACSDDGDGGADDAGGGPTTSVVDNSPAPAPTSSTTPLAPPATNPASTEPLSTEPIAVGAWEAIAAPADCMCSDGSEFTFFVREGNPEKVVFFFEGGGACFNAATCGPGSETFNRRVRSPEARTQGVFDNDDERNPFRGWSMVYVPYCTGDVHIGNATTDYGDGVVINHKGYVNGNAALDELVARFPSATQVVVTGESAGSVPTPLYAGLVGDRLPDADLVVLADGSGAYPDSDGLNAGIGMLWGTPNAIPDWPANEGLTAADWSLPGLFVQAALHNPSIVFARHDYAFDRVQATFSGLVGIDASQLDVLIDGNEVFIEAEGPDELYSYIAPGNSHTVLGSDAFYTESVNGVPFVDWVTALVNGEPMGDVHCEVCTA